MATEPVAAEPFAGGLLLASPGMHSAVFDRTVIILLEHDDDGSMGLVINRPSTIVASEVLPQIGGLADPDVVFLGGPVEEGTALVLAEPNDPTTPELIDLNAPDELDRSSLARVRVFSGYAGWGPLQLDSEMRAGAWITATARPDDLWRPDSESLWAEVLGRQSGLTRFLASYPDQPWLN